MEKEVDYKNLSKNTNNSNGVGNSSNKDFFLVSAVNKCKKTPKPTALDIVKVLLRERAMKQVDLADKIGMTRQGLHNYLRGFWTPPTQIKIKVAEALGVDSSVIWDLK